MQRQPVATRGTSVAKTEMSPRSGDNREIRQSKTSRLWRQAGSLANTKIRNVACGDNQSKRHPLHVVHVASGYDNSGSLDAQPAGLGDSESAPRPASRPPEQTRVRNYSNQPGRPRQDGTTDYTRQAQPTGGRRPKRNYKTNKRKGWQRGNGRKAPPSPTAMRGAKCEEVAYQAKRNRQSKTTNGPTLRKVCMRSKRSRPTKAFEPQKPAPRRCSCARCPRMYKESEDPNPVSATAVTDGGR